MSNTPSLIPPHYLTVTLLCEYQKWSGETITNWEAGQKLVSDLWNALFLHPHRRTAVLYLKDTCGWTQANHQLLAFTGLVWHYKTHIAKHEAHAGLTMAVNKF